jgi:6-pyruvoyl-tetrahydropterin synthase
MSSPVVTVFINTRFEGVHRWADAPDGPIEHLRNPHRHEFHVRVEVLVSHDERDVEFLTLKAEVDNWLDDHLSYRNAEVGLLELSCESMARKIWEWLGSEDYTPVAVSVSEDGENGATLARSISECQMSSVMHQAFKLYLESQPK